MPPAFYDGRCSQPEVTAPAGVQPTEKIAESRCTAFERMQGAAQGWSGQDHGNPGRRSMGLRQGACKHPCPRRHPVVCGQRAEPRPTTPASLRASIQAPYSAPLPWSSL